MKILQINSVCGVGSTGRIATDIHNVLEEQGHESWIAYSRGKARNCDNTIKIGTKLDNYLHALKTRVFDRHGFGSKRATKKFIKEVEKLDPDVIHLHNIHGYYINIKILFNYLKKVKKPVIWTLHDCWNFTGHCAYYDFIKCDKWKSECNKCPQKKNYPTSIFLDNSRMNHRDKISLFTSIENLTLVTPSKWLANEVKKSHLNKFDVRVINNGIDLSVFKPTHSDFRAKYELENKFIILGVANVWGARKGLFYFLELSKKIKDDMVIVLVGLNSTQINSLPTNILGINKTNNIEELAGIYTEADVFVNPTLEDNFPTVNLEALACGTPIITFNTGGSVESIHEDIGLVVEEKNTNELLKAINIMKNNYSEKLTEKCVSRARDNFNKEDKFSEYINIYKLICHNKV